MISVLRKFRGTGKLTKYKGGVRVGAPSIGGQGMRFRIDVNTLDGKVSFEKESAADALEAAKGKNLGVTITDAVDSTTYSLEEFTARLSSRQAPPTSAPLHRCSWTHRARR